ncbi:MerR family transcriptional regulator [Streptomyces sp. NPDC004629]|uniref:MerR family transcriptional regulator n=1 Tax=Streptomyces sp. NPDC004629 TaxID=3364705 RepID=UPI00367D383C
MLIGEVSKRSGVSARMLRHYESLGLVRPSGRTGSGYREYSAKDIRRIFHIESLRSLGLSLRDIGRALDDPGFTPSALVGDLIRQTSDRIAAETELLTRLRRIDTATADQIATRLVDRLAHDTAEAPARGRLTQALAGIPGTTASRALMELSHDEDRAVALTATYLLQLRDTR